MVSVTFPEFYPKPQEKMYAYRCFESFTRRSLLLVPTFFSVLIGIFAIIAVNFGRGASFTFRERSHFRDRFAFSVLAGFPIASTLAILASMDLSAAAISGESAYAIVPELFLTNDKILGTAIVGIAQVRLFLLMFLHSRFSAFFYTFLPIFPFLNLIQSVKMRL